MSIIHYTRIRHCTHYCIDITNIFKNLAIIIISDVNKDLTFKAKDKDKDQTLKDKDQTLKDKDQDKDQTPKDKDKDQTFKAKDQDKD